MPRFREEAHPTVQESDKGKCTATPRDTSDKALSELETFCPRCYEIELQRRWVEELRERRKAERGGVSVEEIRKAEAKARRMLQAHPKCRFCQVLFGGEHLFRNAGRRVCQACRKERDSTGRQQLQKRTPSRLEREEYFEGR